MKSVTVVTKEIDDIRAAADELVASLREQLEPAANMIGFLYYDYEMKSDELARYIRESYDMDIVGCSTIGSFEGKEGYHEMAAILTVLAADDCRFSVVVSEPLTKETAAGHVPAAYDKALERLGAEPKLLCVFPPCSVDVTIDRVLDALSEKSGRLPLVGGIPSSTGTVETSLMVNGECRNDRVVLVLAGGNIRPVFSVGNVTAEISDRYCTVSKVDDTVIYEVDGGKPFTRYIAEYGIDVAEVAANEDRAFFQKYPLLIKDENLAGRDGVPYVRILQGLNLTDGSGTTYAYVPQGAQATLAALRREDIGASAGNAAADLLQKIEKNEADGYRYSAVFCITCAARHFIMTPLHSVEAEAVRSLIPGRLTLNGFYSYGEICPTSVENGAAVNRLHNASIVFCAV